MTPSESLLAHALRTCNIELSGSGRRRELALGLEASGLMLFPAEMTQQERIIEIAGKWGVSVQHLDQILNQLMNRKAGPVKAIERIRGAVIARQEARDKL